MTKLLAILPVLLFMGIVNSKAQDVDIEGYVFESNNRGYLNAVRVVIIDKRLHQAMDTVFTNMDGYFYTSLPANRSYTLHATKDLFFPTAQELSTYHADESKKVFAKVQLERAPGYTFDVTLADSRASEDTVVDAIENAWIEIYNNTTHEEELNLKAYPEPNFQYTFQQGNHYTIMIRKEGYFTKRLEAFVNVDGCILCFEGIGKIENVTDNLTEGLQMGVILANIELDKADLGAKYQIENIYYDYNKANIRADAEHELDKLVQVLNDNQSIIIELGSHTDSRGRDEYNSDLSARRAQSAVEYLIDNGVKRHRIRAKGYGESQLVNDCEDNVPCSEEAHQENRRTEIKVVGFLKDDPRANKSLASIKFEENMDEMLDEISDEVIEIKEGDDIPDAIKEEIARQTGDSSILHSDVLDQAEKVIEIQNEEGGFVVTERSAQSTVEGVTNQKFLPLTESFSGFSVLVEEVNDDAHFSKEKYRLYDAVYVHQLNNSTVAFLIGRYSTLYSAENAASGLQVEFPGARVLKFERGKIVSH